MANGISLRRLRRDIITHGSVHSTQELLEAHQRSPVSGLSFTAALDGEWLALPEEVWNDVLQHLGVHEYTYGGGHKFAGSEDLPGVRIDCDDYMCCAKGRAGLELGCNGLGATIDYSSAHGYLQALCRKAKRIDLKSLEPQLRVPHIWRAHDLIGKPGGMYAAANGEVRF